MTEDLSPISFYRTLIPDAQFEVNERLIEGTPIQELILRARNDQRFRNLINWESLFIRNFGTDTYDLMKIQFPRETDLSLLNRVDRVMLLLTENNMFPFTMYHYDGDTEVIGYRNGRFDLIGAPLSVHDAVFTFIMYFIETENTWVLDSVNDTIIDAYRRDGIQAEDVVRTNSAIRVVSLIFTLLGREDDIDSLVNYYRGDEMIEGD